MNVQRDVNPENDKKLNKMLDDKFGKQNKTIVKGETVRVLQSLTKRVIKTRKQFEDTIFNKPQRQAVSKRRVGKHGSHDQTTHGRHGENAPVVRPIYERSRTELRQNISQLSHELEGPRLMPRSAREDTERHLGQLKRALRSKKSKVTKRGVSKHGQHDQRTHSPTGRAAIARERGTSQSEAKPKPAATEQSHEARELSLFTSNDADLYRQQEVPIQNNLRRKRDKGIYDHEKAVKAYRNLVDNSAKKYAREFSTGVQDAKNIFPGKTRNEVARDMADSWRDTMELEDEDKRKKVTKRKVDKHGDHDQRTHSSTGRAAIARERGKPEGLSSPAPTKVKLRAKLQGAMKDVDAVLDTFDRGTRVYKELKEVKDIIQGRLKEHQQKVTKATMSPGQLTESKRLAERLKGKKDIDNPHALARWMVQNKVTKLTIDEARERHEAQRAARRKIDKSIQKGIGHSLEILTNALKLIARQEPDAEISEADDKKLQGVIDEILGVAGYLDTVKEQGHFEKAVTKHGQHDQSSHAPDGGGSRSHASYAAEADARLKRVSYPRPNKMRINSEVNRAAAMKALKSGMTPKDIARTWSAVWHLDSDGKLGQKYDIEYSDGVKDTNKYITAESLKSAIRRHKKKQKVTKGEPAVPDSSATDRPSFTTPAVAREQKRQRIAPNAKGRGTSTAREPGY